MFNIVKDYFVNDRLFFVYLPGWLVPDNALSLKTFLKWLKPLF